jgi:putative membrane protein
MHAIDGTGGGWIMMFWWILIIPVLFLLIWWGMSAGRKTGSRKTTDPLDTLKDRYAKGEIDEAEYEEKRKKLKK